MRICGGCGVIQASQFNCCAFCQSDYASHRLEAPLRPDGLIWARFEAWFECRSCGMAVAVNHLALDGAVICGSCGVRQALPLKLWEDWLSQAQNVADLAGAAKPVATDPIWRELDATTREIYWGIGKRISYFVHKSGSPLKRDPTFQVVVSPGHPLCERCSVPVQVSLEQAARARRWCPNCAEEAVFVLPPASARRFAAIKAVLAPEHLGDRPAVAASAAAPGGAVALSCPNCQAPLTATDTGQLVTCSYCGAFARIPAQVWKTYYGQSEPVRRWWLLFEPPSPLHRKLM